MIDFYILFIAIKVIIIVIIVLQYVFELFECLIYIMLFPDHFIILIKLFIWILFIFEF